MTYTLSPVAQSLKFSLLALVFSLLMLVGGLTLLIKSPSSSSISFTLILLGFPLTLVYLNILRLNRQQVLIDNSGITFKGFSKSIPTIPWTNFKKVGITAVFYPSRLGSSIIPHLALWHQPESPLTNLTFNSKLWRSANTLGQYTSHNLADLYLNLHSLGETDQAFLEIIRQQPGFIAPISPLIKTKDPKEYSRLVKRYFDDPLAPAKTSQT